MNIAPMKQTGAWLPLVMSFTALAIVGLHIVRYGIARQADEGTSAHLFQLLMAGQAPIVAFFFIKSVAQAPKQTFLILAMQIGAGLAALAPVFFLGW